MPTVEKIGRYEIESELGRGAMGLVYRAVDPNIGRTVALKTMRLDVHGVEQGEMLRRFKNEARAAGLMNHANIVTIYDADEVGGLFYIAMEYLEGQTLQSIMLDKRRISADQMVEVAKQVCAGLDYAHSRKVIHRDIKPANIMITGQNVAKIMDFGIAKSGGSMTSSGQVLGTPNYMSPEQVKGLELDGRADLFSFGVVLYEMTTGERPFAGQNVTTIIYKIVHEHPIAPSELEASIHPGLSAVITRCLAKNRDERYQSGAELARDLENYRSIGSEGDITSIIPLDVHGQETMTSPQASPAWRSPSASIQSGAQGTAVRTSPAVRSSTVQQTRQPASVPESIAPPSTAATKNRAATAAAAALAIIAASATIYAVKHRSPAALHPSPQAAQPQASSPVAVALEPTEPKMNPQLNPATSGKSPQTDIKQGATEAKAARSALAKKTNASEPQAPERTAISAATKVQIRFTSNPPGAFVQIDGRSSSEWITPFTMPDLTPGAHEVVFTKQGYTTETRSLEIGPKNDTYPINLVPVTTAVSVSSEPPGANIEIDGRDTGKVTPAQIPVAEGQHRVVVRLDGYRPAQVEANVNRGQVFNFPPILNPMNAREAGTANTVTNKLGKIFGRGITSDKGVIDFVTTPPGAKILIEGRPAAFATPAHVSAPPGDYRVEFREPGYKPVQQTVHVESGKISKVNVVLDPR